MSEGMMMCESIKSLEQIDLNEVFGQLKVDGERCMIIKDDDVVIINRRGKNKSETYFEVRDEVSLVSGNFVIDGEMALFNENDFSKFQRRALLTDRNKIKERAKEMPVVFYVFDVLKFNGKDLTNLPLIERKKYLEKFRNLEHIQVLNYFETPQEIGGLWEYVKKNNREGIILKLKNSVYEFRRSRNWIKLKNWKEITIEMSIYEFNNAGVKLVSEDGLYEVQVPRLDLRDKIKEKIDMGEKVRIEVEYLERGKSGKLRFPHYKKVLI